MSQTKLLYFKETNLNSENSELLYPIESRKDGNKIIYDVIDVDGKVMKSFSTKDEAKSYSIKQQDIAQKNEIERIEEFIKGKTDSKKQVKKSRSEKLGKKI